MPGICTSRNPSAGRSASIRRSASTPSAAWPTTVTSSPERNPWRRSRASFSSSTTSARIGGIRSRRGYGGRDRQAQVDLRPTPRRTPDLREMRGAVEAGEAIAEIAQADAALVDALERGVRHAEAVVPHDQIEATVVHRDVDPYRARA